MYSSLLQRVYPSEIIIIIKHAQKPVVVEQFHPIFRFYSQFNLSEAATFLDCVKKAHQCSFWFLPIFHDLWHMTDKAIILDISSEF